MRRLIGGWASAAVLFCLGLASPSHAENWPQWRGPAGNSISAETGLPVAWNSETGIVWTTPLPEWGTSTPCIWGDAIFVTSHQEEGDGLLLIRLDKNSGEVKWTQSVGSGTAKRMPLRLKSEDERREQRFHQLHNLASPSPVTDGNLVVVHFGNGDLAAYDFDGNQRWRRNLQDDYGAYTVWWGHANSPALFENLVISVCMQDSLQGIAESPSESYVVAHEITTGREVWRTLRMTKSDAEEGDSYTTPLLYKAGERWELAVMGGNQLDAYDPATGKQLWHLPGIVGGRTVTGPTAGNGMIYATQGKAGPLLALKTGGEGQLSKNEVIVWKHELGTPDTCTPVLWGDLLFTVTDGGVAQCFDALTGKLQWKERMKGNYKASPIAADGRIYFLSTDGVCTVVAAAAKFERLAENKLDAETIASPAVSEGNIYIRGRKALFCIGKP